MRTRERSRSSKRSARARRRKEKSNDMYTEGVDSGSREVFQNEESAYEIESSEESSKRKEGGLGNTSKRSLKRGRTEIEEISKEEKREVIEMERIPSRTLNNESHSSTTTTSREKRKRSARKKDRDRNTEIPITEVLRKALDKEHTDHYGETVTSSVLTTDKIYVQGKNGFSAVRIPMVSEEDRKSALKRPLSDVNVLGRSFATLATVKGISAPITVAVLAQKCWKRTALVYQGLLAGMALVHFTMIRVFFDVSMEFVSRYSLFSEIYSSLFYLLIALSVVSIFDKFDLAHWETNRLNGIRGDNVGPAIAVPLYVATLCLHETLANVDDRLALIHHSDFKDSLWSNNTTSMEDFLDELTTWQKINLSKDLLATLSWILVAVGTRDDTLLTRLECIMEEYKNDVETPCVE